MSSDLLVSPVPVRSVSKSAVLDVRVKRVYIAGPMRGIEFYNFPAFDAAARLLTRCGFLPVNPAAHDRECGFDPRRLPDGFDWRSIPDGFDLRATMRWDIDQVFACDALYMLLGWEHSKGARAEYHLAECLGKEILFESDEKG